MEHKYSAMLSGNSPITLSTLFSTWGTYSMRSLMRNVAKLRRPSGSARSNDTVLRSRIFTSGGYEIVIKVHSQSLGITLTSVDAVVDFGRSAYETVTTRTEPSETIVYTPTS